ncbi:MAG TPA: DNA polymerase III subunit alpha [Ignavibacteriaceae bacterium]|nr:DNA polymerase III subunit alpha [Ignavibacteriaceae bacterium]
MPEFVHLHNHTHFSLQDGACKVETLVKAAKDFNMHAVALTDHGVLYGVPSFFKHAMEAGIKPIIGMEAYIVKEGSRHDRRSDDQTGVGRRKKKYYNHLILLAKNQQGYHNLIKLSSYGFLEGFYYKPRIDLELLEKYKEGIVCTSACIGGVVASDLAEGNYKKAKEVAKTYKDIFGNDFYLEIQNHNMEEELPVLEGMPRIGKELGIKLVATNDCHYIKQEDAYSHNILLLLSDKTGEGDYRNLRYGTDQIYFKSQDEMINQFRDFPEAVESTLEIADKIEIFMKDKETLHFPTIPIPESSRATDLDDYLSELAHAGLEKRYPDLTKEIEDRFRYELDVIKNMGFAGYFLVVADFINAARERNILVGPGRGSAAGSIVAYALGITNVDPRKYDLLFERFLNPARKSMPDIDVDFADDRRGEVIDYVKDKYGHECVTQIITFNTLSSKAVIRDVARVLKIPISTVNSITKYIPSKFGKVYSIETALNEVPELKWVKDSKDEQIVNLIKHAKVLEGMNRNASKHAAGVVIAPSDVSDFVPLSNPAAQDEIVTQFNMLELEKFGILKMDFLGLRTLTIIKDTIELVKKNHNIEINIDEIEDGDELTYKLFAKGQTSGVFQFESPPMREYLKKLKPRSIKDLAAMNALYRPGPMEFIDDFLDRKYGRKPIEYAHPILGDILKETYGIIVYQEQVIQIANKVGGMSLGEADILRRAMGKKNLKMMAEQKAKFIKGAVENKISEKVASEIFENIDKFANYGFNKSHAVAYSIIAYQTAFLKAHYTPEFLAANLKNEFGDQDKVAKFLEDCRKLKISVLAPNINKPSVFFDVEKGKIRFGLSAIKNVGVNAIEEIKRSREKLGRNFKSLFEFCSNVDTRVVNKRTLEGLILAGAFDSVNKNRALLLHNVESALNFGSRFQEYKRKNTDSLFGFDENDISLMEPKLDHCNDWSESEKLAREREVIGFYVSDHPLRKFELEYRSFSNIHLGETEHITESQAVRACGVLNGINTKIDKSNRTMAFFKLDDFTGFCDCIMFASTYSKFAGFIKDEACVMVIGKLESSGDAVKLNAEEIIPMEKARERFTKYLKIIIDREKYDPESIKTLKEILLKHQGAMSVIIELINNGDDRNRFVLKQMKIKLTNTFINEVQKLYGEESVWLVPK